MLLIRLWKSPAPQPVPFPLQNIRCYNQNMLSSSVPDRVFGIRAVLSILLPALSAVLVALLATKILDVRSVSNQAISAALLSVAALVSWLLGLRWYGTGGMGLRGGRAFTAAIGFASLIWIIFLVLRFVFVEINPSALAARPPNAGRTYIYLLLFEALATQVWTFGLIFRATSDWRGPLTASIVSGIVFGLVATLLFQESYLSNLTSVFYFIMWGILYGIIRLRTGSLLGTVVIQSVQSFTTWIVIAPYPEPNVGQLNNLYLSAAIAYLLVAWRLWPKNESDYRV